MLSACPLSAIMASMKKKKNIVLRILCAMLFVLLSGIIMLSIYTLSNEDGFDSSVRSESVTESLKQEVKDRLNRDPLFTLWIRLERKCAQISPFFDLLRVGVDDLYHFGYPWMQKAFQNFSHRPRMWCVCGFRRAPSRRCHGKDNVEARCAH